MVIRHHRVPGVCFDVLIFSFLFCSFCHLANATENKNKSPKRGKVDSCSVLHVESTLNSLIKEQTRIWGGRFFHLLHESMVEFFLIRLHEKLKVWWKVKLMMSKAIPLATHSFKKSNKINHSP